MKPYHYLLSWILTLFVGIVFNLLLLSGNIEGAFGNTLGAALFSLPFIILFCVGMWGFLRTKPDRITLHLITFMLHVLGTFITWSLLTAIFGDMLPYEFDILIGSYFVIDSVFFHVFIQLKSEKDTIDS